MCTNNPVMAVADTWGRGGSNPKYFGGQWSFVKKQGGNVTSFIKTIGLPPKRTGSFNVGTILYTGLNGSRAGKTRNKTSEPFGNFACWEAIMQSFHKLLSY